MKIGLNGSAEEIKNFMANSGSGIKDIIKHRIEVSWKAIIIALVAFIALSLALWEVSNPPHIIKGLLTILVLMVMCFVASAIHLKFNNWVVTGLCLAIMLAIAGISLGLFNVKEAIENLQKIPSVK